MAANGKSWLRTQCCHPRADFGSGGQLETAETTDAVNVSRRRLEDQRLLEEGNRSPFFCPAVTAIWQSCKKKHKKWSNASPLPTVQTLPWSSRPTMILCPTSDCEASRCNVGDATAHAALALVDLVAPPAERRLVAAAPAPLSRAPVELGTALTAVERLPRARWRASSVPTARGKHACTVGSSFPYVPGHHVSFKVVDEHAVDEHGADCVQLM